MFYAYLQLIYMSCFQIINEQKKEPILGRINIEEFAAVILTPYCSLGEKVDSQDRVRFCLILVSICMQLIILYVNAFFM